MSVCFDYHRHRRIGLPESVYCEGKELSILMTLVEELAKKKKPILLTRLSEEKCKVLRDKYGHYLDYHVLSKTAFLNGTFPKIKKGSVAVVTAGTSDLGAAYEAGRTLDFLGISNKIFSDVGVAGLWRIEKNIDSINTFDVIIVAAGMDAALASVIGGMTPKPVIAVPTSVGYGVAQGGQAALHSMLLSCSPGIVVTNIDNGYGAACAAFRFLAAKKFHR